mgnify:CR=1 FL=1
MFIKCFKNSKLLSGPNRFSVCPSYLFSLIKGVLDLDMCMDYFSITTILLISIKGNELKKFQVGYGSQTAKTIVWTFLKSKRGVLEIY